MKPAITLVLGLALLGGNAFAQEENDDEVSVPGSSAKSSEGTLGAAETSVAAPPAEIVAAEVETAPLSADNRAFQIGGYIQPQFDFRYRPNAFPRDRTEYGARATRTGLVLGGQPLDRWSYSFHVVASAGLLDAISSVDSVDVDGDGESDGVQTSRTRTPGIFIERATVTFEAMDGLDIEVGQMRIPFSLQAQSPNTALMFPDRSGPNEVFLSGTDLGGMIQYSHPIGQLALGVYNGTGANYTSSQQRGLLYAARVDVHPLGEFPFSEGANRNAPLRVGIGAGLLYYPSERFANSGFEGIEARDLRASVSVRMAWRGLYVSGELLRRQQTDSLSSRPLVATGGYGQASYYLPIRADKLGISPMARAGVTVEDQSFDPRSTLFLEAGVALYLHRGNSARDTVKLIVEYLGELRLTEEENAHGAVTQLQLVF